ncbi:cryptochrome/photolyase family protein [Candidatus Symbiobacter mobilis]|nr:deoxyribodipyrimidine photo-lyase [Candidatus Symbiobacter mobilis]
MDVPYELGLVWFRRDLRLDDNAALALALRSCRRVHCAFLFDRDILDSLPRQDRRVEFLVLCVRELDEALRNEGAHPGCGLIVLHGRAQAELVTLALDLGVQAVFAAHDDESTSIERDTQVREALLPHGIALHTCKDHTIFERQEILTQSGSPYTVFTPYRKAWFARLGATDCAAHDTRSLPHALAQRPAQYQRPVPTLEELGFAHTNLGSLPIPVGMSGAQRLLDDFLTRIDRYADTRDFPAIKGPSYLGVHLRFGTISIRTLVRIAWPLHLAGNASATTWISELVWRDFYFSILANFPHVTSGASFKPAYDAIAWEQGPQAEARFAAWCAGQTGYPLVDAAMAQLAQTGYMHNRLRMVAGSFLVKDLGIDWRWGERFFATHLNDFDLAANNGGWQWVSSSGCDAQPFFRIFHPVTQSEKFDAQGKFIRRYLPQLARLPDRWIHAPWRASPLELDAAGVVLGGNYPLPIVDHDAARRATLARYAVTKAVNG